MKADDFWAHVPPFDPETGTYRLKIEELAAKQIAKLSSPKFIYIEDGSGDVVAVEACPRCREKERGACTCENNKETEETED